MIAEAKKDDAIRECLMWFLSDFNFARYVIDNPVERLEKYFDLHCDKEWRIYVSMHTYEWDIELWETSDIDLADLQNVIYWLRNRVKNYLWLNYNIDA